MFFYPNGMERNMLLKAAKDSEAKHQDGDSKTLTLSSSGLPSRCPACTV